MPDVVNQSYYKPEYHKKYYKKNKQRIIDRAKNRWANLTDREREEYYEDRKKKRKLKKENKIIGDSNGC